MLLQSLTENVQLAITIFLFIWIYNWAKGNVGSTKLAFVTALVIMFLTFYQFPELVWGLVFLWAFATFGKDVFTKVNVFGK
ncbi:MAG: hypothetical protein Q8P05_04500 [Candidatus Diapherotrites archaeon]|nr:hypothetical protein [Candidatus Diapherotrites archaeon]MDZ4256803.1 hypothetical protein [archaeon]